MVARELHEIGEVYIFVADNEDGEGVIAELMGGAWIPMIATRPSLLARMAEQVRQIAAKSGREVRCLKFTTRTDVTEEILGA